MNDVVITEKDYPVEYKWVYKSVFGFIVAVVVTLVAFLFGYVYYYLVIIVIYAPIHFILTIFRWMNFHYTLEKKYLIVKQGVLSKQERNLPYGVIQNVFVKQDLLDRLFGLSSLTIENAVQGKNDQKGIFDQKNQGETIGSSGSKINIPGLTRNNAGKLKALILEQIKENPADDNQSGL